MSPCIRHPVKKRLAFFGLPGTVMMICGLLILLVLAVYWQTREFSFVTFDDDLFVYKNGHVLRGLTLENVNWSMTAGIGKDAQDADYWRPLSLMSHMLDVSLFGLNAGAHHMMNVALHALTAVALFLVMHGMTAALWRSAFVAALFAVHPLHVESVAWIAERKDVLSGLFFVLAAGAYRFYALRPFRWGGYLLTLLMSALAMMSKPMLVTLPCVLLLLDLWPLKRLGSVPLKRLFVEKIPLFAMAAMVAALTLGSQGAKNDALWAQLPWYYRAGNALLSYGVYIRQTFWPSGLACFYPFPGISRFDSNAGTSLDVGQIVLSSVVLLSISAIVWWQRKKSWFVVGWLWYLGMLAPVIGLLTQAGDQAHADRYTYLSMIGLSLMIAWPVALWAGEHPMRKRMAGGSAVLVILILAVIAKNQVTHWRNGVSLWTRAVECNPKDYASHYGLGNALIEAGRFDDAVSTYQRALKINPLLSRANLVVGVSLLGQGRLDEAEECLRRVLMVEPLTAAAQSGLAYVLLCKGELQQAIAHYRTAVSLAPDAASYCGLGNALLQAGDLPGAIESYQRSVAADPKQLDASVGLGMAHARLGQMDAAASYYKTVLAVNPQHLPAINNLAWLLATSRQDSIRNGSQALALAEYALQLPGGSKAHLLHTLAAACAETGQYDKAGQIALEAATMATAQNNVALAQQIMNERKAYLARSPWRE